MHENFPLNRVHLSSASVSVTVSVQETRCILQPSYKDGGFMPLVRIPDPKDPFPKELEFGQNSRFHPHGKPAIQ